MAHYILVSHGTLRALSQLTVHKHCAAFSLHFGFIFSQDSSLSPQDFTRPASATAAASGLSRCPVHCKMLSVSMSCLNHLTITECADEGASDAVTQQPGGKKPRRMVKVRKKM